MKINEVAKLTGVTVRTLHYYDQIGLLKPKKVTEAGYRIYDEESLKVLQQILFFKELEFPLTEIKEIMKNPSYDQQEALSKQRELLLKKREHIDGLIKLTEQSLKGVTTMSFKEFDQSELERQKIEYAKEVKERWGNTDAYAESQKKTKGYNKEQWQQINEGMAEIFKGFGELYENGSKPECKEAQELAAKWQQYITDHFYTCTKEIFAGLGMMYIADERFKKNLDQYGEGTAQFISDAIAEYCK